LQKIKNVKKKEKEYAQKLAEQKNQQAPPS